MPKKKHRKKIEELGKQEAEAYTRGQRKFSVVQEQNPHWGYEEFMFLEPANTKEYREYKKQEQREWKLRRKRHALEEKAGELKCRSCRHWIPFLRNRPCPHCWYSNYRG